MTDVPTSKSKNRNYLQLTAYVQKDIALKFKSALAASNLEQSATIEALIEEWLKDQ